MLARWYPAWIGPPRGLLPRVRWAFLLVALFDILLSLLLSAASDAPVPLRLGGILAAGFLGWHWQRGYRRGHFSLVGDFVSPIALLLVGLGAGDTMRAGVVLYASLFLHAVFGNRRRLVLATCLNLGAYVVAIALSPTRAALSPWSPEIVLQPSGVAMIGVMYVLGSTLARHERASVRERALARVGTQLVASTDVETVYAATLECVQAIVAPHAPPQAILIAGDADTMRVIGTTSVNAPRLCGIALDLHQLPAVRDLLLAGKPVEATREQIGVPAAALGLPTSSATAYTVPLFARQKLCGALAVMSATSLPDECKDGLQALAMDVALAFDNISLREHLEHNAFYDSLTGLANRALLTDRTQHALSRVDRDGGSVAVLLLDVDGFKTINDSLGHVAGDRVLKEVAARLQGCLRPSDTAARLGGDEFAVLVEEPGPDPLETAEHIALRILDALRAPIVLPSTELFATASLGIAIGQGTDCVEELLSHADVAMYAAKRSGKARFSVFVPDLRSDVVERLEMETDLRRALEAGQFTLHYQPIVDLGTRRAVAVEALVRWNHPRRGLVSPDQFIPLAEETGLIVPLGRWVLQEACRQVRQWQVNYPDSAPLTVHVNVAVRQLREAAFVSEVSAALFEAGASPRSLVLEVTENVLIHRSDGVVERLHELRELGIHLALDDFGTGYSSLAYLRDLPFDSVKIDKSFVAGVESDSGQAALVRAIINLSKSLKLVPLPEGVEEAAQAAILQGLGCELAQGYYFARPAEASAIEQVLFGQQHMERFVA
jgi:diguanylate cyclase (GGDEF)-like protein